MRTGRSLVTTGVQLENESTLYATGQTTFSRIARAPNPGPSDQLNIETLSTPLEIPHHPLDVPLDAAVGIEVVSAAEGHVRLPLREALLNPEGVLQGALIALVVESAALAVAESESRGSPAGPHAVTELDLRYLAAASVGPLESRAAWIASRDERMLTVELRDRGRENRLTTTAFVRVCELTNGN